MTRERKREFFQRVFDKISIEGYSLHMTDTRFLDDFLSLEGLVLELEEFFIRQLMLRELVGLQCLWCV